MTDDHSATAYLIEQTLDDVGPAGPNVMLQVFDRLLAEHPEADVLFTHPGDSDRQMLAARLYPIVLGLGRGYRHIADAGPLLRSMGLGLAHAGAGPDVYRWIGDALIDTLGDALGTRFTDAHRRAWLEGYGVVATAMQAAGASARAGR